jgi:hypothetical protein
MAFKFVALEQHAYDFDCIPLCVGMPMISNSLSWVATLRMSRIDLHHQRIFQPALKCTVPVSVDGTLSSSHAVNDGVPWGGEWGAPPSHRPSRLQNDQCTSENVISSVFGICAGGLIDLSDYYHISTVGRTSYIALKALAPHLKLQPNDFTSASASRMDSHLSYIGNAGTFLFGQGTLVLYL